MFLAPLLLALAVAQVPPSESSPQFYPALRWKQHDVDHWLSIVENGRLSELAEALWCLYYADDRSARILDALRSVEKQSPNAVVRRIADPILCQGQVDHEQIDS